MPAKSEAAHPILGDIRAALNEGRRRDAIGLAVKAMGDLDLTLPWVVRLVAEGMEEDGLILEGLAAYNRAQMEAPGDLTLKKDFAAALIRHGAADEALAPLDIVLAKTPRDFEALMLRGRAHAALRDFARARDDLDLARRVKPASPDPLEELADIAARLGDADARRLGLHALQLSPGAARAAIAVARTQLAEGEPGAAHDLLERTLAHPRLTDDDRANLLTYLGDALDALDRPAEAFAAWRAREGALRPSRARALAAGAGAQHILLAKRLAGWLPEAARNGWQAPPSPQGHDLGEAAGHIFVMSFPRSGTTLLAQSLAAHPQILAADESGALGQATDELNLDANGLARLERMTAAEAEAYRQAYWAKLQPALSAPVAGRVVLDKDPLNSVRLPIIAKLFPRAKILFAVRDPRDVVLSGYRRLFYSKMLEFYSLDSAARFYDAVSSLNILYRERLTLDLLEVRHEALVVDQERQMREILSFLGLEWSPQVLDLGAAPQLSTTPSAAQLARGLNAEGVGAWRRHVEGLAEILPLLAPWVERLGYEASPSVTPRTQDRAMSPAPILTSAPLVQAALEAAQGALRAGQTARAMQIGADALQRGLSHPLFHRLRGVQFEQAGRPAEAIADFEAALAIEGEEPQLLNVLGLCLARAGRAREGLVRLDRAIALKGDVPAFHYNRGWALEVLGDVVAAREAYETAASRDPKDARTLGALAALAARRGDWAEARSWSARAQAVDPDQPAAALALARAEAAQGDPQAARERLERFLATPRATPHERAVTLNALGDILDQLDRPDEAFSAYAQGAEGLAALYGDAREGAGSTLHLAERLADDIRLSPHAAWGDLPTIASPARRHVFLLGFPRSGTTMLGQALAGHPDVVTLDERPTLADAAQIYTFPPDGLERLMAAGEAELDPLREAYWRRVREGGAEPEGKVFVDKLPMNTLGLPLIRRLFPDAKVIFLRRDPRDVVLSCLRRQFVVDATTLDLLNPHSAARLYDRVMRLMEVGRERLQLDLQEQSFEALVGEFESEMTRLCRFLDLTYTPEMADFAARSELVATPSAVQLARGLNAEGVGVWRRYATHLAPIQGVLAPWVERFGYDPA